jgi:pimeloyl-ACP methyl ester carboxylesterase
MARCARRSLSVLCVFLVTAMIASPRAVLAEEDAPASQPGRATSSSVAGTWRGTLKVAAAELHLVFHIDEQDGGLTATIDSPDQGARGIPVSNISFTDGELTLRARVIGGRYDGRLSDDTQSLTGKWRQSGRVFPLEMHRTDDVPSVSRPQDPKPPYPYRELEVVYINSHDRVRLAGTLTIPHGDGPFAAAVLISGSGAQDRDESLMGHRPFVVLADYLTRRGIAVLRTDDRGIGGSGRGAGDDTTETYAGDVRSAVAFLRTLGEIDGDRIGLIGHSEGGMIAAMVAAHSREVAFIVMMAGTGIPGEQILYRQSELLLRAEGHSERMIELNRELQQHLFAVLKSDNDERTIREELDKLIDDIPAAERRALLANLDAQLALMMTPWFRFFLTYDPAEALARIQCPVLALIGEKDLQVSPQENLTAIRAALKRGDNPDYTVRQLPGLNHLFQTAATGAASEYARIEETIAPAALEFIGDWILERTRPPQSAAATRPERVPSGANDAAP